MRGGRLESPCSRNIFSPASTVVTGDNLGYYALEWWLGANMQVIIGVFISLAAALLFFVVEPMLLGLDETWRTIAAGIVFFVVIGISFYLHWRSSGTAKEPRSIAMQNDSKGDLDIEMKNVRAKDGSGNIASENKSGGNTKINISDSDL